MGKERLDRLLVSRGLADTREQAQRIIMAGEVLVGGELATKPGSAYPDDVDIVVLGAPIPYVSRGGLKLQKALDEFAISLEGAVAMDIGASTGGFTDCMLQRGARRVYAIDVGYGQLAWKLRQDDRVVVLEKTNIRYLPVESIPDPIDFISVDVSFISVTKFSSRLRLFAADDCGLVVLIKPQFEAGPVRVGKNGIVRDPSVHRDVLMSVISALQADGFACKALTYSPIKGQKGNIEFLTYLRVSEGPVEPFPASEVALCVERAHAEL